MTKEEKEMLIKDLAARLPYGLKISTRIVGNTRFTDSELSGELLDDFIKKDWGEIKPYLRPMSSMTEEEKLHIVDMAVKDYTRNEYYIAYFDYLISIHIDYRGLIPMGLALEAKEGMYNLKSI